MREYCLFLAWIMARELGLIGAVSPPCKWVHELVWKEFALISFFLFSLVIGYVSSILVECHKTVGAVFTKPNYTYMGVIGSNLGRGETKTNLITRTSTGTAIRPPNIRESFQALGDIAFAYFYSVILIEIQDTIVRPPPEAKTMKKASLASLTITTTFYMICGYMGYASFGDCAFYNPNPLLDIANVPILVSFIGAYQVDCQPIFVLVEKWAAQKCPTMDFNTKDFEVPIRGYGPYDLNLFRLICRTTFAVLTTIIPKFLPFFDDIVRILGAFGFRPLTGYLPMEMYIEYKRRYLSGVQDGFPFKPLALFVLKSLLQLLQDRSRGHHP